MKLVLKQKKKKKKSFMSLIATVDGAYVLPIKNGRPIPNNEFTPKSICKTKFMENSTATAVGVAAVLPCLTLINEELDSRIRQGDDLGMEELKDIALRSGKKSLLGYGDRLMRITSQTVVASCISLSNNPVGLSSIYLWDLTPRVNRFYFDALFKRLQLPKFLGMLTGPAPTAADIKYFTAKPSVGAVVEDSIKRKFIFAAGDLITISIQNAYQLYTQRKIDPLRLVQQGFGLLCTFLCPCVGATLGYCVGGGSGEFWGDLLSTSLSPTVAALIFNAVRVKAKKPKEKHGRHRSSTGHKDKV